MSFEEATRRNVKAMIAHGNETRTLVRSMETKIQALENTVQSYKILLEQYNKQLAALQQQFYLKGSTSYGDNNKLANKGD